MAAAVALPPMCALEKPQDLPAASRVDKAPHWSPNASNKKLTTDSMKRLPTSIPRNTDIERFREDPLRFLAQARSAFGDMVVLRDGGPILSRGRDCAGSIAVFGSTCVQTVLTDITLFGMPESAAQHLSLPAGLVNLNCGAHSMQGERHAQHQRLLLRVLNERSFGDQRDAVSAGLEMFAHGWHVGDRIGLLTAMRELALQVSSRLLFGERYGERDELARLVQVYFHARREVSSPFRTASNTSREELIALGTALDNAMRRYTRWCRRNVAASSDGILSKLASLDVGAERPLTEDELVAHGNVLFVSSNEPIAVTLAWILLILSQLPSLRRALRLELDHVQSRGTLPQVHELMQLSLLNAVVSESLRLLPPNALMVRVTTRPAQLGDALLPERCELILSPFLAHRDPELFPFPSAFRPSRWREMKPSPFEFFPFGGGGRHCVGRSLALYLIKAALAFLIGRYDLLLAEDQEIGWRVHIIFMPSNEPIMTVGPVNALQSRHSGKLLGAVNDLVNLDSNEVWC